MGRFLELGRLITQIADTIVIRLHALILVVHELFAEDPEIRTESAGEGKFRHIVLKYRDSAFAKP